MSLESLLQLELGRRRYTFPQVTFVSQLTPTNQPLQTLLFGNLVQLFVSFSSAETAYFQDSKNATIVQEFNTAAANLRSAASLQASYIVYIGTCPLIHSMSLLTFLPGVGTFVCTYIYMVIWVYTGELNAKRIREKYLQAVLRQDITYYDTVGAGEIATRIQTDTRTSVTFHCLSTLNLLLIRSDTGSHVRQGCSHCKLYLCFPYRLHPCLRSLLETCSCNIFHSPLLYNRRRPHGYPCVEIPTVCILSISFDFPSHIFHRSSLNHIARSGTLAEEVISTIRTAHAFGIQKTLDRLYDVPVQSALLGDYKTAIIQGSCVAFLMFAIYSAYALGTDESH
jgi:ATP-binding cassette, subfamily B (MDR/TAP), member 1